MRSIVVVGRARWLVLGVVAMMPLAGCGNDAKSTSDQTPPVTVSVLAGVNDQQDSNIAVLENLPEAVTVSPGSTVEWRFAGLEPHTVTFLPPGQAAPTPGSPEADALFAPSTPTVTSYDGTSLVNSGLLPAGPAAAEPFRLKFPTEGEFSYICVLHPRVTGKVTVVGKGAAVDTQAAVDERASKELDMWLTEGRAAKKKLTDAAPKQVENPDGTIGWTYEMGADTEHTSVLAFSPANGEVRPGDSVTFVNNSLAPHTATFASGGQVTQNPADPAASAPTGPSPLVLKATGGPYNTGLLPPAAPPDAPPPEAVRSYTFVIPQAGSYSYVCILHTGSTMVGSVKVA